ncbi:MAG: O-methyltransferase [Solirubrobacterales bacterium]
MSVEATPIDAELAAYIQAHASGRDEALKNVEERTAAMGSIVMMQTAPEQAAFLEMLVRMLDARLALEIGTFTGYGAIRIARGLGAGGRLICFELEQERADIARANLDEAGVGERTEIVVGPAIEGIRALPETAVDFAYLDADKTSYPEYYEELVPRLRPGGLLAIDNVFMGGRILDKDPDDGTRAAQQLNETIMEDERVDSVMLTMADGLTLVRRTGS